MKFTGRNGTLRIYDSAAVLHGAAPLDGITIDVVKYDGAAWSNIAPNVEADDASVESAFLADDNDVIYLGSTSKFAMFRYLKGDGTNYAAGSGAMILTYFDGTDFDGAVAGASDGSASGGDCFAQDGYMSFQIPADWALGANAFNANLDADKYYIAIMLTSTPGTAPDADVLCPVDGQYLDVPFAEMDLSGPLGRPLREEILVLERGTMNANAHYILGPSDKLMEPLEAGFSCLIHSTYKAQVMEAIACGTPGAGTTWTAAGTSSKGTTQNDGSTDNPAFDDADKKTVNVQVLWNTERSGGVLFGLAYYEVYFPEGEQVMSESGDAISLKLKGACYGLIERIYGFGNRY